MELIVGLGNPGSEYVHTRHNLGFQVVEVLSRLWQLPLSKQNFGSHWVQGRLGRQTILLAQPYNYMNRSGLAVSQLLAYFKLGPEHLLVIHDDLDVPLGALKIALKGGAGGHRGVSSIIQALGTQEFVRLKVGIGRPQQMESIEDYVLSPCYPEEAAMFAAMIQRAAQAVEVLITAGVAPAMSQFHGLPPVT